MVYTEEKLAEIEQDIISGIDKEQNFLSEIEDNARFITDKFMHGQNHVSFKFMDTEYIFSLSSDRSLKEIVVMRTDPIKMMIGNGHYIPAIFKGEWDMNFTFEENVFMVVKTSLASAAGIINTDLLEETADEEGLS